MKNISIAKAVHNIESRRGNIRELTTAEIVIELESELSSLKAMEGNDFCICEGDHDINIISLDPPKAICMNCNRPIADEIKKEINRDYHKFDSMFAGLEGNQLPAVTDIDIMEKAGDEARRLTTNSLYRSGFYDGYKLGAKALRDNKITK